MVHPSPARKIVLTALITTVATVTIGYGPSGAFRAGDDFVNEAAVLIFSNDLDAAIAACADGNRSTVGRNRRTIELVRAPVVRIGRRKKDVPNFTTRVVHDRDGS